jgi:hydroxymethylbilane synthase
MTHNLVITTQATDQANQLTNYLLQSGIETLSLPAIETQTITPDEKFWEKFGIVFKTDFFLFTSKNGVKSFFELLLSFQGSYELADYQQIVCIGKSTALGLKKYGHSAYYVNSGNTSAEFAENLKNSEIIHNSKLLILQGNLSDTLLKKELSKICTATQMIVYETYAPKSYDAGILEKIRTDQYDLLVFTSPSAFTNFINVFGTPLNELRIATIGQTTTKAIEKQGFKVELTSSEATLQQLSNEIKLYLQHKNH